MKLTFESRNPLQEDGANQLLAKLLGERKTGTLLASTPRTSTTSSVEVDLSNCRGIILFWTISAASGTGGLLLFPEHQDPITGTWTRFWNYPSAVRTTTGALMVQCGPGIGTQVSGGLSGLGIFSTLVGRMRFTINHADASSYTYSLGYEVIP